MKKIVILPSVTALFMTACEKEEKNPVTTVNVVVKEKNGSNDKVAPNYVSQNYRFFLNKIRFQTGGVTFSGDCFSQDVLITSEMARNVKDLFDAIENGEQSAIQTQFTNHADFLIDLLSKEMSLDMAQVILDEVVNGGLIVNAIYNNEVKEGGVKRFIRFVSHKNQEQVLVLPFTKS